MRELDYIGVLELDHNYKAEYTLCVLEKVSYNHEESKVFVDRILGINHIIWRMGQHKFGTPSLPRSEILCDVIESKAESIKDALISTLWVDAELYNMIYYSIFFLSKDKAKRILKDIVKVYCGFTTHHRECYLNYFAALAKMFYKVMKNEKMDEIPYPCGYEAKDITDRIQKDLGLDNDTEFIILFMVQAVGTYEGASKKRIENQAECIANILSNNTLKRYSHAYILMNETIKDQVDILLDKLRKKGIERLCGLCECCKKSGKPA